jgi:multimeric flavodoxin WrbA
MIWEVIRVTKKIVAVNASPRKGWNTDTLVSEAVKGAESTAVDFSAAVLLF